jgi:hypothetical protein
MGTLQTGGAAKVTQWTVAMSAFYDQRSFGLQEWHLLRTASHRWLYLTMVLA